MIAEKTNEDVQIIKDILALLDKKSLEEWVATLSDDKSDKETKELAKKELLTLKTAWLSKMMFLAPLLRMAKTVPTLKETIIAQALMLDSSDKLATTMLDSSGKLITTLEEVAINIDSRRCEWSRGCSTLAVDLPQINRAVAEAKRVNSEQL